MRLKLGVFSNLSDCNANCRMFKHFFVCLVGKGTYLVSLGTPIRGWPCLTVIDWMLTERSLTLPIDPGLTESLFGGSELRLLLSD